jgi:divalent metal cation (Fe/Co/Zn/Cd) transporter
MPTMLRRKRHLAQAIRWCALSVAWASLVGITALVAGAVAGSLALVGFGADSIVDGLASAVLVRRFSRERSRSGNPDRLEHRAAQIIGLVLIAIGLYLVVRAIGALVGHSNPDRSMIGIVLTAASVLVLPALARAKLRLSRALRSRALRGDGVLSLAGAVLALAALLSLLVDSAFGWWWADAVAALAIALFLLREGGRTLPLARGVL